MARIIDVHNHLYPRMWLDYLERRVEWPTIHWTGATSLIVHAAASRDVVLTHIDRPGHYELEPRIEDMDRYGIDVQILSLAFPGVELLPAAEGVAWAKWVNDYFAEVCQRYPGRFYAAAALPYQDVGEALQELERAYKELGVKGIMMFSHINGKPLFSPEFDPIYARASEYRLPIILHPTSPLTADAMKKLGLPYQLFGFPLDTTMAVISLIFQGVLERFPALTILQPHLGGVVPYLVERVDDSFRGYARDWGIELPKMPSQYYREQVYVDSVNYHVPALRCCLDWLGAEHICLGTDYAHRSGHPETAVAYIRGLGLSREDTDNILGGNAARIFRLP